MLPYDFHVLAALVYVYPLAAQITIEPATSPSPVPTPLDGDSQWASLGCYNELDSNASARALGATGTYITPPLITPDNLTVSLCLNGCGAALAPSSGEPYIYACVENSQECYCGRTLSNLSTPQDEAYCSSPCTGNLNNSCGGFGYIELYELRSASNTTTSSTTLQQTSSETSPPTSTATALHGKNKTGMWVGIALGIFFAVLLILLALYFTYRRHRRKQAQKQDTLNDKGTSITAPIPSTFRRQPTSSTTSYGPQFGTTAGDGEYYVSLLSGISEENEERRKRVSKDAWKKGYVPPLSPDHVGVPMEAENAQMRRGTLADAGNVPLNSPDDGLGALGLSYVNSRLAGLKNSGGKSGYFDNPGSGKEAPSVKSWDSFKSRECAATGSGYIESGEEVGNEEAEHEYGNAVPRSVGDSSEGICFGSSKQVMGREGAEQLAWWEKPSSDHNQKRKWNDPKPGESRNQNLR